MTTEIIDGGKNEEEKFHCVLAISKSYRKFILLDSSRFSFFFSKIFGCFKLNVKNGNCREKLKQSFELSRFIKKKKDTLGGF